MAIAGQGGNRKPAHVLWPLPTDTSISQLKPDEMYERNERVIKEMQKRNLL